MMLSQLTLASKPPAPIVAVVTGVNAIAQEVAAGNSRKLDTAIALVPDLVLPAHIPPDEFKHIPNGTFTSNLPDTFEKSEDTHVRFISSSPDDRLVKLDCVFVFNNERYDSFTAGNGVTPFFVPDPPNHQSTSTMIHVPKRLVGSWREDYTLTYESGFVQTYSHSYTVTGDPGPIYEPEELYIGNLPVPQYKEDWQQIVDFWDGRDANKHADALTYRDAAPAKPNPITHPYQFPLNSTDGSAPADIQQLKSLATSGQVAGGTGIGIYESYAPISNDAEHRVAMNAELAHYRAISNSWTALANSTSNPNIKAVAQMNAYFTANFTKDMQFAFNGINGMTFAIAEGAWLLYEQYMGWFIKQSANDIRNMEAWDQLLGAPT